MRREKHNNNNNNIVSIATRAFSTVCVTAAVTINSYSAQAFVVGGGGVPQQRFCSTGCSLFNGGTWKKSNGNNGIQLLPSTTGSLTTSSNTRLFSSFRKRDDDDNDNNDGGFLAKLGKVAKNTAKAILPNSWFQSDKEQKAAIERKRVKNQLSRDMNDMLKDAPLAVRMLGNVVAPLLGNVMSGLAETMAEQQQVVNVLLEKAQECLENDDVVASVLGSGAIQVDAPFSQSSSTTSINGLTQTRVEFAFAVSASRGSGVARLTAANNEIQQLVLQTSDGRTISVNINKGSGGRGQRLQGRNAAKMSSSSSSSNVIEAEIIEKDTKR